MITFILDAGLVAAAVLVLAACWGGIAVWRQWRWEERAAALAEAEDFIPEENWVNDLRPWAATQVWGGLDAKQLAAKIYAEAVEAK